MGWGRMFLLGDWGQQMDIEEQKEELRSMRREIRGAKRRPNTELVERLAAVERENDELRLHLAALIRHLGNTEALDKDAFGALIDVLDNEDGTADNSFEGPLVD